MVFLSFWEDEMYLPEDTGNWVEATYGWSCQWQYTKIKFRGMVIQEST